MLFCHQDSPKVLGQILLDGKLIEPPDLEAAFVFQVQALFDRLFSLSRRDLLPLLGWTQ